MAGFLHTPNLWVCYLCNRLGLPWAWLCHNKFFIFLFFLFYNLRVFLIQIKYIYSFIFYFFSGKNVPWNTTLGYTHSSFWDLKSLIFPKRDFGNTPSQDLQLKHLSRIDLSGCIKILPNAIFEMILKLKHLKYFEPPLLERRYAEHGFSWLLRTPRKPSSQILTYVI